MANSLKHQLQAVRLPGWRLSVLIMSRKQARLSGNRSSGRLHMHSACGLLDADFRTPSLDYIDLIKASRQLCKSPAAGQLQFRRAVFNLLSSKPRRPQ